MPLIETLPIGADTAQWTVWGTTARVVVTDPARVATAERLVRAELAAVDAACSRFRPDSELARLAAGGGRVSPPLATLVTAALQAARDTGGDVDPTLGGTMCARPTCRPRSRSTSTAPWRPALAVPSGRSPTDPERSG
jgi:thiamine biosynthesis lipoprotein